MGGPRGENRGLYVDGRKVELAGGLCVFFVSDKIPFCELPLTHSERLELESGIQQWKARDCESFMRRAVLPKFGVTPSSRKEPDPSVDT